MQLQGIIRSRLLLRAVVLCALAALVSTSESVRAHAEEATRESQTDSRFHANEAPGTLPEEWKYCHPGLDCFVTAITTLNPAVEASDMVTFAAFGFSAHSLESRWLPLEPRPQNRS